MLIVYATATFVAVRHEFLEQLDDQLHDDFETAEGLLTWMPDGRVAWVGDRHLDPDDDEVRIVYEVWSPRVSRYTDLAHLLSCRRLPSGLTGVRSPVRNRRCERRALAHVDCDHTHRGHSVVLRVSRSEERLRGQLSEILVVLVLGLPLVVVLAGVGGYILARRALVPIDRLASEAQTHHGRASARAPDRSKSDGRNRPADDGHQRYVRAPRILVRPTAAIHGRRVP